MIDVFASSLMLATTAYLLLVGGQFKCGPVANPDDPLE